MTQHQVIIAGGGPTGMMLAAELALAGVDVALVERRPGPELAGSRAGGLHARTLEVFDQRGIADRFLAEGTPAAGMHFHETLMDVSVLPSRHATVLGLWQNHIERILADWIAGLPIIQFRQREVTGFTQDQTGVDVALSDGASLRTRYLVGCDGGRSLIRKQAGIDFPGSDATTSWLIAEVMPAEEPKWGFVQDEHGLHGIGPVTPGEPLARVVITERGIGQGDPSLDEVRAAMRQSFGTDWGVHSPVWLSRFNDMSRQAAAYRASRVLIAGDAAHVHAPLGGQGLNIGVQDAVNLGWKLAQVVHGTSPDSLLDTYQAERHPVAARVLRNVMAQVALRRRDDRSKALGDIVTDLLALTEARRRIAAEISGLAIRYDLGDGHPLLGRRMPDLDLTLDGETHRLFTLLHEARSILLNLGPPGALADIPRPDRVQLIDARYEGPWDLPETGPVSAPTAVLIRPDGYVAWAGEGSTAGLTEALAAWFGD